MKLSGKSVAPARMVWGYKRDHPHILRRAETLPKGQSASAFAAAIGKACLYVTEAQMAAFEQRFLTLGGEMEFDLPHQACFARLRAAGVKPFSAAGQDFGLIYERHEVELVLCATGT